MGLPTVAFDTPISREYLGGLGVYAGRSGDPAPLADAIDSLLGSPERCAELGRALRRRAARHYSRDRFGRQLQSVYRTVLQHRDRD